MKKALIIIALVIILLCSLAVSGIPFNLVVGRESSRSLDVWGQGELYFNIDFAKNVFVGSVAMSAHKTAYRCGGMWRADLYNTGQRIITGTEMHICRGFDNPCFRYENFMFESGDRIVIGTPGMQYESSDYGACNFHIFGNAYFIEGRRIPFAVSSKNGSLLLGTLNDLLNNFVFIETTGAEFSIASDNPRVLVWTGNQDDSSTLQAKTGNLDGNVWACYDGDQNKKCDFSENITCTVDGDYYNGICCGVDVQDDYVSYLGGKEIHGLCGRISAGDWVWVTKENFGEIFNLNYYPGQSIVSDGKKFFSCTNSGAGEISFRDYIIIEESYHSCPEGYNNVVSMFADFTLCINFAGAVVNEGTDDEGTSGFEPALCPSGYEELGVFVRRSTVGMWQKHKYRVCAPGSAHILPASFSQFINISTKYGAHTYMCSAGRMFECSGGKPFSTSNIAPLGSDSRSLSGFVCPLGMVAYWTFDADSGSAVNNALGNFAGGNANSVSFVSGHIGNAARFSNPNSDIYVDHATVNLALPSISIETWIKPSSLSGRHVILNKEGSYELYLDSGILKASLYSDSSPASAFLAANNPVTNDVWSHIALVYDGSAARIYHNSHSVASSPLNGRINSSASPLRIGARSYAPTEPFEGLIDEVALYSTTLPAADITAHYSSPSSYCSIANVSGVYYCASDGDWTKDLDIKDEVSCRSASFNWTGHKCCSELDDANESYSDYSTPAVNITDVAGEKNNIALLSDYSIALNSTDSFVVIHGPARISVLRSSFRSERGEIVFCEDKEVSSFDLKEGQSKRITNYNYPDPVCSIGRTTVASLPTLAFGGCFHKNFYPSGSFLYEKSVINANGEFVACKQSPAGLQQYEFIRAQASPCGRPINDVFPGQAAVCLPSGDWHFIDNADNTVVDETAWNPADFNIDAYRQGCCPLDKCWNGTGCQPADTYYSVANKGFVCR